MTHDPPGPRHRDDAHGLDAVTRGCLGGTGFCFISHRGIVQPCGFLDLNCGDVTQQSFGEIWNKSDHFVKLRDFGQLEDKCGYCEYRKVCDGSAVAAARTTVSRKRYRCIPKVSPTAAFVCAEPDAPTRCPYTVAPTATASTRRAPPSIRTSAQAFIVEPVVKMSSRITIRFRWRSTAGSRVKTALTFERR